jgi:carbonic anhydrase
MIGTVGGSGLERRRLLSMAVFGCTLCRMAASPRAEETPHIPSGSAPPHWTYEGETGAAHWGGLTPAFKTCQLGLQQSPIDLVNGVTAELRNDLAVAYRPIPLRIINNGHTIQINADTGCSSTITGTHYELIQFHFHHPSEHLLSGRSFDLECHFVHRSAAGDFAVLGAFIRPGTPNGALQPIWNAMPRQEGPERNAGQSIDPASLLPTAREHYRYMGSLTTPPCSEGITWTMFREPIEASPDQIRQFAALFANNARPTQRMNRRFLLQTF